MRHDGLRSYYERVMGDTMCPFTRIQYWHDNLQVKCHCFIGHGECFFVGSLSSWIVGLVTRRVTDRSSGPSQRGSIRERTVFDGIRELTLV